MVLLFFDSFDHAIKGSDEIQFFFTAVAIVAVPFVDLQFQVVELLPEAVDEIKVRKLLPHFVYSSLGIIGLPDNQQQVSGFDFGIVIAEEGPEDAHQNFDDIVVFFVYDVQQVTENYHLFFFFDESEDHSGEGDEHMVLVDAVESAHEYELFGLADVFWVNTEVDRGAVPNEVVNHGRSDDCELVGEIDVAGEVGLDFVDVDEIGEFFDDGEVHVPHLLLGDVIHPLHGLKGMNDAIGLAVIDVELLLELILHIVRVRVLPQKCLIIVEDLLVLLYIVPLCLLQGGLLLIVLVLAVEIDQFVGDVDYPLVRRVRVRTLVVESLLVSKVVTFCSHSFELQVCLAVPALRHNAADVAVLLLCCHHERVDADRGLPSGIVFEHCDEYANVVDFAVLGLLEGEMKGAHELRLRGCMPYALNYIGQSMRHTIRTTAILLY